MNTFPICKLRESERGGGDYASAHQLGVVQLELRLLVLIGLNKHREHIRPQHRSAGPNIRLPPRNLLSHERPYFALRLEHLPKSGVHINFVFEGSAEERSTWGVAAAAATVART